MASPPARLAHSSPPNNLERARLSRDPFLFFIFIPGPPNLLRYSWPNTHDWHHYPQYNSNNHNPQLHHPPTSFLLPPLVPLPSPLTSRSIPFSPHPLRVHSQPSLWHQRHTLSYPSIPTILAHLPCDPGNNPHLSLLLQRAGFRPCLDSELGDPVIWSFNPLSEKELNEKEEEYEARNALVAVVRALRERVATQARDKSFAMMGILERLGILPKPADHKKSLGHVYHELFVQLLRREPALIALLVDVDGTKGIRRRAAESEHGLEGALSWVPNWSQLRTRHCINYDESIYQRIQLGIWI
ncbi:hypothetical protein QBC45DRAFT_470387 [Copromyces sp. CBS 386.78]|nr:hypothetical protein QBC45DRAFT_470387 [Copromyces sp. CBS 386.78]